MTAWMYEGNGLKLMREFYAKYDMINFPGGNTGAQMGGWYRKEIKKAADLKGMKLRMGGFAGKVFERMGGVPANIPGGEIYTALEKGTIDAAEWVGPYDDQKLGFNKVAPFTTTQVGGKAAHSSISSSTKKHTTHCLPKTKQLLSMQQLTHTPTCKRNTTPRNPAALKQLVGAGTKLRRFPKDVMDLAFKESMALYDELNAKNPDWKKIYADYSKFRADSNLGSASQKHRFDDFMQHKNCNS